MFYFKLTDSLCTWDLSFNRAGLSVIYLYFHIELNRLQVLGNDDDTNHDADRDYII